jgi:hypothetical protein
MSEQIERVNMGQTVIRKEFYNYPSADEIISQVPEGDRIVSLSVTPTKQSQNSSYMRVYQAYLVTESRIEVPKLLTT